MSSIRLQSYETLRRKQAYLECMGYGIPVITYLAKSNKHYDYVRRRAFVRVFSKIAWQVREHTLLGVEVVLCFGTQGALRDHNGRQDGDLV